MNTVSYIFSYFLTMTGYLDGSGQYGEVLGSLGSSPPLAPHSIRPILYIPHFSPEMTLPLHTAGEALSYLISNDNFVTYTDLQVSVFLGLVWFGLLGFNASATARVISRR